MIEGIPAPSAYLYNFMVKKRRNFDKKIAEGVTSKIKEGRLLDVGTGPGIIPIEIAKTNPNLEVWGIDISKTMIKLAKKNAEKAGVNNVRFEVMSVYNLEFPNEHFNFIISVGALHHFSNPLRAFNEMYRVLKSGGEAWIYDFITDVSKQELREFLKSVNFPYFPWGIGFRLHGLKYKEWVGRIFQAAKRSSFDEYALEKQGALMKLILKKS
ncbi:class I SAM-dependent methyltransferase [Thermococcus sp. M39]|uniref:class I SAM-dependent methyltransferase n=1 Tax=unclassified Thermococcus TaxID=2627626 RepID=UPI00143BEE7A|nr:MULTISPECIES: class I SAM-dependent methyltransferase [unclassified Thermococcus]NJE09033.1 class I SAM-dependent methyltransferase [Thermococcus sp. M39]NJE13302.1 class I SAM-dependent methyltransferase [Thermococcus sp. LS2]